MTEKCKYFSIDFILTTCRYRGQWTPSSLSKLLQADKTTPSGFACREALLGLAYREGGYTLGLKVADELHLTVPWVMT
jgi:hypothetical protein